MPRKGYKWTDAHRESYMKSDHRKKLIERAKEPKSEETKQKMSEAKIGVKKSEEHKANMRIAHKRRLEILFKIIDDYGYTYKEARQKYKEHKDEYVD